MYSSLLSIAGFLVFVCFGGVFVCSSVFSFFVCYVQGVFCLCLCFFVFLLVLYCMFSFVCFSRLGCCLLLSCFRCCFVFVVVLLFMLIVVCVCCLWSCLFFSFCGTLVLLFCYVVVFVVLWYVWFSAPF